MNKTNKKILIFDIETAPSIGAYFQLYREGNIVWTDKDWYMLSFCAKWLGEDDVIKESLPMYTSYKKNPEDDKKLCETLWKLFDEADVIIAHNGDPFDIKKSNARFIINGLTPPSPYQTIDTKKVAKKYFNFDSNKLTDLGLYFNLGEKMETGGIDLWRDCLKGDMDAWDKMVEYNAQDVILLEKIYLHMRPWMTNHPNMNLLNETTMNCPNCGLSNMKRHKTRMSRIGKRQQYQCGECGAYATGELIKQDKVLS